MLGHAWLFFVLLCYRNATAWSAETIRMWVSAVLYHLLRLNQAVEQIVSLTFKGSWGRKKRFVLIDCRENYRKNSSYCRFIMVFIWGKKGDFWRAKSFGRGSKSRVQMRF